MIRTSPEFMDLRCFVGLDSVLVNKHFLGCSILVVKQVGLVLASESEALEAPSARGIGTLAQRQEPSTQRTRVC